MSSVKNMNNNTATFITLLSQQNLLALLKHYKQSSEQENLQQIDFLYQQSLKNPSSYQQLQELATRCIATKPWPVSFNSHINTSDLLSFLTPALQLDSNINQCDNNNRNVLHYLLLGNNNEQQNKTPPFVYLRSLMLFESNLNVVEALCKRDNHKFTPFEIYLGANHQLTNLAHHEFTAALALIEIQNKSIPAEKSNLAPIIKSVNKMCNAQTITPSEQLHRLQLIATNFSVPVIQLLT